MTPSSTAEESGSEGLAGFAVLLQIEVVEDAAAVVNDQENRGGHGIARTIRGTADRGCVGRGVGQGRAGGQSGRVVGAVVGDGCRHRARRILEREADRAGLHRSLNVAVAVVDTATPVAPDAGVSLVTAGGAASVVKDQENGAVMETLEAFWAPLIVAV